MEFSSRESLYAKQAEAMVGNIDSTTLFESITKATGATTTTSKQTEPAQSSKPVPVQIEMQDIRNPMNTQVDP